MLLTFKQLSRWRWEAYSFDGTQRYVLWCTDRRNSQWSIRTFEVRHSARIAKYHEILHGTVDDAKERCSLIHFLYREQFIANHLLGAESLDRLCDFRVGAVPTEANHGLSFATLCPGDCRAVSYDDKVMYRAFLRPGQDKTMPWSASVSRSIHMLRGVTSNHQLTVVRQWDGIPGLSDAIRLCGMWHLVHHDCPHDKTR